MATKFWYGLCIGVFFCSNIIQALNFTLFTENVDRFQDQMKAVCNQLGSGNLAFAELALQGLVGANYYSLIDISANDKVGLIDWVREEFCLFDGERLADLNFELYVREVFDSKRRAQYLFESLTTLNLAALEYLWPVFFSEGYEVVIKEQLALKNFILRPLALIAAGNDSVYEAPVAAVIPTGKSEAGSDLEPGVSSSRQAHIDYLSVLRGPTGIKPSDSFFCAAVGKPLVESKACGKMINRVGRSECPDLNKYNQGYFAIPLVVFDNDYHLFKDFIPSGIKSALTGISDENISFYVEISSGSGFYDKGRRYNLIFHGALADWYDADMTAAGFNFETGGFERNLPMGIFDFNPRGLPAEPFELSGIQPGTEGFVRVGEAIAKNGLSPQNVSAHNGLYSPDNAGFIMRDGRHIIVFWSVARSDDKRRAVVTLHILFDWQLPNNFKDRVFALSQNKAGVRSVGQLLNELQGLSRFLAAGPDHTAWDESLNYLKQMYRQR